jgi:ABC-type spermidine/putrescine transport system permease subunit I
MQINLNSMFLLVCFLFCFAFCLFWVFFSQNKQETSDRKVFFNIDSTFKTWLPLWVVCDSVIVSFIEVIYSLYMSYTLCLHTQS